MKIFIYILMALSIALLIFNITQIDWEQPFEGQSTVAIIGVLACACGFVLLLILQQSKKIRDKVGK